VKVRHDEGLANRIVPELCISGREASGEASVGDGTGQPLSRDRNILGADAVEIAEGNMVEHANASARGNPAWSETLACADAPCTGTGRSRVWPAAMRVTGAGTHTASYHRVPATQREKTSLPGRWPW
jgi:hypothetical protein